MFYGVALTYIIKSMTNCRVALWWLELKLNPLGSHLLFEDIDFGKMEAKICECKTDLDQA